MLKRWKEMIEREKEMRERDLVDTQYMWQITGYCVQWAQRLNTSEFSVQVRTVFGYSRTNTYDNNWFCLCTTLHCPAWVHVMCICRILQVKIPFCPWWTLLFFNLIIHICVRASKMTATEGELNFTTLCLSFFFHFKSSSVSYTVFYQMGTTGYTDHKLSLQSKMVKISP